MSVCVVKPNSCFHAGNNAHVVVQAAPAGRSLPFAAVRATRLSTAKVPTVAGLEVPPVKPAEEIAVVIASQKDVDGDLAAFIWACCSEIIGDDTAAPKPGVEDNLMEAGLDSLGLAELVNQIEAQFGEDSITIEDIMTNPTLNHVATIVSNHVKTGASRLAQQHAGTSLPSAKTGAVEPLSLAGAIDAVWKVCVQVIGDETIGTPEPDAVLLDLGLDSLGLAELVNLIEQNFGEGHINIEDVLGTTLAEVAAKLAGAVSAAPMAPQTATTVTDGPAAGFGAAFAVDQDAEAESWVDSAWIRTTHVGSLPRQMPDGLPLSLKAVISKQLATGISCINDGEYTRENYVSESLDRCGGIGSGISGAGVTLCACEMPCAADMLDVPLYSKRFTGGNGIITLNPKRPALNDMACVKPPRYAADGAERLAASLEPFLAAIRDAGRDPSTCFWSVPSPGTLAMFCEDRCFDGDHFKYVNAFAAALRTEYEQIANTGMILQVDCPDLAMGRHTRHIDNTDAEFVSQIAEVNVAALNHALENVPKEQVRIHICWGNYAGPHHKDINADKIWPVIGKVKTKYILIEAANPRHVHEVKAFERAVQRGDFTSDQVIVPGVIDTTAARVEHPAAIAEKLLRFVRAAGHPSRVMAGTDCGFASTAKSVAVTADLAWQKLASLVEGAQLATRMYLQDSAPVPVVTPKFNATVFRCAVITAESDGPEVQSHAIQVASALGKVAAFTDFFDQSTEQLVFDGLRWAVDSPLAIVGVGAGGGAIAQAVWKLLQADTSVSRRPNHVFVQQEKQLGEAAMDPEFLVKLVMSGRDEAAVAAEVGQYMTKDLTFDKRRLVLDSSPLDDIFPAQDNAELVVVVGAGLLGLMAAKRLVDEGIPVAVLEQRALVGGIWSMYANSTSQVNSSEGGYCMKEFLPDDYEGKHDNRDHSTAAEILHDLETLAKSLEGCIYTGITVCKVLGTDGEYTVIANHAQTAAPVKKNHDLLYETFSSVLFLPVRSDS